MTRRNLFITILNEVRNGSTRAGVIANALRCDRRAVEAALDDMTADGLLVARVVDAFALSYRLA